MVLYMCVLQGMADLDTSGLKVPSLYVPMAESKSGMALSLESCCCLCCRPKVACLPALPLTPTPVVAPAE